MRLRKALQKAERERQESGIETKLKPVRSPHKIVQKAAWTPPVYYESKSLKPAVGQMQKNRCICLYPNCPESEEYKVLRTQILQRTNKNGWRTIMITSPRSGDGKTVTAINLAITLAREHNQTVLLVDCDLRSPTIYQYMGLKCDGGLGDYLTGRLPLNKLIVWPGIEKLTVISGGKGVAQESTELLGSQLMHSLVQEMKERYDDRYILFDVPPILEGADAMVFAPLVDSIIMVAEIGRTPIVDAKKSLELIPKEKFLGFALNRKKMPTRKRIMNL